MRIRVKGLRLWVRGLGPRPSAQVLLGCRLLGFWSYNPNLGRAPTTNSGILGIYMDLYITTFCQSLLVGGGPT